MVSGFPLTLAPTPPASSNLPPPFWSLFSCRKAENTSKMQMAKKDLILFKEALRFGAFSFGRVPPSDPSPHRVE